MPITLRRFAALAALLSLATTALAQLAPPPQTHAANLGAGQFRAAVGTDFSSSGRFTLEGWIYLTGNTSFAWIVGKGLATSGSDPFLAYSLQLSEDGTKLAFNASTGAPGTHRSVVSTSPLPLRMWTHIAAVVDGTTARLFINAQNVATGSLAGPVANPTDVPLGVGIGYRPDGRTNYSAFPGLARQFRLWTVARTAAQLAADATAALPVDRNGLYAAWPFDESSGSGARDLSGNNRSLTGGGVWVRLAIAEAPFFAISATTPPGNVLADADDGILVDFDSDGDPDLLTFHVTHPPTVPETRRRIRAFRNTNGTFADVTDAVLGNVTMVHPRDRHVADFNGDGRADVLIVGHGTDTRPFPGEQAKLLIQSPDGRLVDESALRLPQRNGFTHNLAVGDIDGDGDLDAYFANIFGGDTGPRFLINSGTGTFTEATDRLPADIANRASTGPGTFSVYAAAALVDVNGDNRPDLILGGENSSPANELLLNDGTGRFVRNPAFTLPPKLFSARAVTVAIVGADLNADGAHDLLVSTTGGSIRLADGRTIDGYGVPGLQLLLNRGNGTFYDATAQLNLAFNASTDTWIEWIRVADLDADGRPDLVLQGAPTGTGIAFSRSILLNRGGAVFVDASEAYMGGTATYLQPGDVNRDGLVDLVGINSNAIVVSRALRPLGRALFLSTADEVGRLANLSVRTQAGTGDQTLITGFALSGSGSKPLLVRAVGPTLSVFGLTGTLADPQVEIAPLGGTNVAGNNNWAGTLALKEAFASVGAFALAADTSLDSALVFSLTPGAYTAKVTGANNGTGVALVEVYELPTPPAAPSIRLINLSARTQVGTGGNVLIAGFVVNGNVPRKLLLRAVGPTLDAFGVGGTLADPVLELRPLGSENIVATNDDWRGTAALKTTFGRVGAFALGADNSRDAAIAIELPAGAYTATVSGKNNTTGVALIEVYELP